MQHALTLKKKPVREYRSFYAIQASWSWINSSTFNYYIVKNKDVTFNVGKQRNSEPIRYQLMQDARCKQVSNPLLCLNLGRKTRALKFIQTHEKSFGTWDLLGEWHHDFHSFFYFSAGMENDGWNETRFFEKKQIRNKEQPLFLQLQTKLWMKYSSSKKNEPILIMPNSGNTNIRNNLFY